MKKNNRQQYLQAWLTYLKGKTQIDPKALVDFLGKTLKGAFSPITMKRYTATIIANLYENGILAGKTGKIFSGEPLEIVQEITLPVLDKCLTRDSKKIKFTETDQPSGPVEPVAKVPAPKKVRKAGGKKKVEKPEVAAEKTVKKGPAKKPAKKPVKAKAKKAVKPEPKKPVEAKKEKPAGRKPVPQKKKVLEAPKKAKVAKAQKNPAKKPARKPGKKAVAMVPVIPGKKPAVKKAGLIGRKTDLLKMGEGAFLFAIRQQDQIEEMERLIANYERVFEAVRQLFSREMEEMEDLVAGLLE